MARKLKVKIAEPMLWSEPREGSIPVKNGEIRYCIKPQDDGSEKAYFARVNKEGKLMRLVKSKNTEEEVGTRQQPIPCISIRIS